MCMEDVKIGRSLDSQIKQITTAGATPTRILSASTARYSFSVSLGSAANVWVYPRGGQTGNTIGFALNVASPRLTFHLDDIGSMMYQDWFAEDDAGVTTLTIIDNVLEAKKANELR